MRETIERHYARSDVVQAIRNASREAGKDPANLAPSHLAAVDEFHVRGREASLGLGRSNRSGAQLVSWSNSARSGRWPAAPGFHLLAGPEFSAMAENMRRNLEENRFALIEVICQRA